MLPTPSVLQMICGFMTRSSDLHVPHLILMLMLVIFLLFKLITYPMLHYMNFGISALVIKVRT